MNDLSSRLNKDPNIHVSFIGTLYYGSLCIFFLCYELRLFATYFLKPLLMLRYGHIAKQMERTMHFLKWDTFKDLLINAGSDLNIYEGMKPTSEMQFKLRCNLIRGTKDKKIIPTVSGLANQLDEKECYQQMISRT